MATETRRFLKSEAEGGRTIATLDELVGAMLQYWGYDRMAESPFPSREPPPQAARKWFAEHLRLTVKGPNRFEWTCPGCQARLDVETNYLHTCLMFDYEYWQFCPSCATTLDDEAQAGA